MFKIAYLQAIYTYIDILRIGALTKACKNLYKILAVALMSSG